MVALKLTIVFLACFVCIGYSAPTFFGGKNEHFVIHVPYKVHTVHHHHVEKVPIYKEVPVIKHVPVYKEVHVPVVKEVHIPVPIHDHHDHHEHHGWY
ncbi:unnamed protein product [Hermetia illucens]|uniref:Uncharacterized protein n=1 Tax=Hermetia illucens TaxID=343691 RepID=A0A7R8YLP1_HERIL|nr:uncharacterized protein DDB_G0272718 [Hermetia illucens]CAD7076602.1 unnamed protein product [Hermetia illucens]